MLWIFRKIIDRLQTLLIADAALGLEAEFLSRQADRKAELLRKAQELDEQGFDAVADDLRRQAAELSVETPISSVLPTAAKLEGEVATEEPPKLESSTKPTSAPDKPNGTRTKKAKKTVKSKAR